MISKAIIMGRLGGDPEIRHTTDGKIVATVSIATTVKRKGDKHTTWHKVIFWNKLGEVAKEHLGKGKLVYVEGNLQSREWGDKDGKRFRSYEIIATKLVMIPSSNNQKKETANDDVFVDEDLPL